MTTTAERHLAAEVRAVEEGHHAVAQDDGSIRVVSDRHPGRHYIVTFWAGHAGGDIHWTCTPHGPGAGSDDHGTISGELRCKHQALAARRLEREGFAEWTPTGWVATDKAAPALPADFDPFAGIG